LDTRILDLMATVIERCEPPPEPAPGHPPGRPCGCWPPCAGSCAKACRGAACGPASDLTGPKPTGRGKKGTKHHVAVYGDGVPVACVATAANTQRHRPVRAIVPAPAADARRLGRVESFAVGGMLAYQRDVPKAEMHILDAGHFALDENVDEVAALMRAFLAKQNSGNPHEKQEDCPRP